MKAKMSQKANMSQHQSKPGGPQVTESGLRPAKVKNSLRFSDLLSVKAGLENVGELWCNKEGHASLDGWE